MTDTTTRSPVDLAREHAVKSWRTFTDTRNLRVPLADWQTSVTPDGSPCLSAEVAGSGAAHALSRFASDYQMNLPYPGDQRPQFDVMAVGRTVLVWRCLGVWVELWHPDSAPENVPVPEPVQAAPVLAQAVPTPTPAVAEPVRRSFLRPSGRLPFTRKRTDKETTTT